MSIFKGPGILLNPAMVGNPASLPQAFTLTLAAGTNTCSLADELGAIAYAFHEGNNADAGAQLFEILESGYTLADKADDVSKCLANELIPYNVRVNTINPGLVMTPDWQKTAKLLTEGKDITWQEYLNQIAKDNAPIGRFASPEEVANLFVFLCSPRASYCVGSTYYVDGGWLKVIT